MTTLSQLAPRPVKEALKSLMRLTGRHWARPSLVGRGTVQDLYYWVSDGETDRVIRPHVLSLLGREQVPVSQVSM